MKRLVLLFFFIITGLSYSQKIGDTSSPYSTQGWDEPYGFTLHYQFPIYRLLSNPGGYINLSQDKMDSLFYALIVYTDTMQMVIENDTLHLSSYMSGVGGFSTTDDTSHITVAGLSPNDIVIVTARGSTYNVNDILFVKTSTGYFTVKRNSSGTSNLQFNWIWIRKY